MTSLPPQNPRPFVVALWAGTAYANFWTVVSRESDLDERMAKVAHLHVLGLFGPGTVINVT